MHRFLAEIVATGVVMSIALLVLVAAGTDLVRRLAAPAPRDAVCAQAPVLAEANSPIGGTAWLCFAEGQVTIETEIDGLGPGLVYTAWLQYFDLPSACRSVPCGEADLVGADPAGIGARVDGLIAEAPGRARLAGAFPSLRLSPESRVQLVILTHGPAHDDNKMRARQLLTGYGYPTVELLAQGLATRPAARASFTLLGAGTH